MLPKFINRSTLPHQPGIYIYKDASDSILYVGKAIDLYHRVASYFNKSSSTAKTSALVKLIASVETIVVESELEALILEANLIKKFKPPYNTKLTDDKDYLYIAVTKETYPKVITARVTQLTQAKKYFGPFPSATTTRNTLRQLRWVFPWCSNPPKSGYLHRPGFLDATGVAKTWHQPCFYYHLGLCPGPCIGKISQPDYQKIISRFIKFMDGKKDELVDELTREMNRRSEGQQYEQAAKIKKMLDGVNYLTQTNKVEAYLENPNFLQDQNRVSLEDLKRDLSLPNLPERIEAYDISNLQGREATGSMVVLTGGEIDKSQYRRFKIRMENKPNDVGMHQEMMRRRLNHREWPLPQLFLIDGGRGQVRAAESELKAKSINLPIYGLAKRMEWLYPPEGEVIKLPKRSLSLRLLQKIRDESHRFAIIYHRKLRNRQLGIM